MVTKPMRMDRNWRPLVIFCGIFAGALAERATATAMKPRPEVVTRASELCVRVPAPLPVTVPPLPLPPLPGLRQDRVASRPAALRRVLHHR